MKFILKTEEQLVKIMLLDILTAALTLFAVIDMIGNIPLIIKLRKEHGEINSLQGTLISAAIMIVTLFVGETVFFRPVSLWVSGR